MRTVQLGHHPEGGDLRSMWTVLACFLLLLSVAVGEQQILKIDVFGSTEPSIRRGIDRSPKYMWFDVPMSAPVPTKPDAECAETSFSTPVFVISMPGRKARRDHIQREFCRAKVIYNSLRLFPAIVLSGQNSADISMLSVTKS